MDIPTQSITSQAVQQEAGETQPYAPSFIDRLMDWVEQLPISYWLTYLVLLLVQVLFNHVVAWVDGWLPALKWNSLNIIYPLWTWGPLAIITYLDAASLKALSEFSPLLDISPENIQQLKHEFTTMPARGAIISACIWVGLYPIWTYIAYPTYVASGFGTLATIDSILGGLGICLIGSIIVYHTIRQLRLVHRTVKLAKQFDLFRLDPVYAYSLLTSRTGAAWVLLISVTFLLVPIQLAPVLVVATLIEGVVLALAAFALPLWVVHQHLVMEKRRLMAEHGRRVESTLARLHRNLDNNELGEIAELNNALTGLNVERDMLVKIPTWPWRSGLFTGFLSVVVLPTVIFLIQLGLGRWVGR